MAKKAKPKQPKTKKYSGTAQLKGSGDEVLKALLSTKKIKKK